MGWHHGVRPGGSDTYEEIRMILTEEQLLIQETARKFAQERIAPNSGQWEQDAAFPPGIFKELGALGIAPVIAQRDTASHFPAEANRWKPPQKPCSATRLRCRF